MKRLLLIAFVLLLSISLFGCASAANDVQNKAPVQQTSENDEKTIEKLVEDFGKKLQMVSLLAPKDVLEKSMKENYGEHVSDALLEEWIKNPMNAPGRLTSSPWPDRIEISGIKKMTEYTYRVEGEVIEVTSVEKEKGGAAAKRPITLALKKADNRWLIDDVSLGAYERADSVIYKNTQYGFSVPLPESWKGYTIVTESWEGLSVENPQNNKPAEAGPMLSIRHPKWTAENPRQDIPIMIFTLDQWNALQEGKFHIGAAPVGPKELGRNEKYVFALPARYNFAFPAGFEEVEEILKSNPLQTNNNFIGLGC